jgi:gliding-associated putative ABC transporter substrate-binding component GldG
MNAKKTAERGVQTIAVLGSIILVNVLSIYYFARLDLTRDRQFTLSDATVTTLEDLQDPVTIRAYFSKDLPPPLSSHARYVRDLLEEYYAYADGNLRYEFIDPLSEETQADKEKKKDVKQDIFGRAVREQTSVERDLSEMGITPVQVRVNEDDKLEVKRAYLGIAINYGDKREVMPVVQDTGGLEYDLTTLIRKLTREKTPKIAVLEGHEGPDPQKDLGQAFGLMSQLYDVIPLDLTSSPQIPDDVDAILVIGPKTPFSEEEQKEIDRFIVNGGAAAFLLDAVKPDLQTLETEETDSGLNDLLTSYGATPEPGLVLDAECATINISQQKGFMRITQPVNYPFIPQPRSLDPYHPLTRGLSQAVFPFMSPLKVTLPESSAVEAEVLVRSSDRSWVELPPYDLNPMQPWTEDQVGAQALHDLVVTLTGTIPSHFGASAPPATDGEAVKGRVLVAGGSTFIQDQFLSMGNQALLLNLIDWLVLDDALLAVRSRGLEAAPLEELTDGQRNAVKYLNMLGLPLVFVAFGLVRWRMRERRRAHVGF